MSKKLKIDNDFWGGYQSPEQSYPVSQRKRGRKKPVKNKTSTMLKELARSYCTEAIEIVVELMRCSDDEEMQLAAAECLLDRGLGKVGLNEVDVPNGILGTLNVQFVKADNNELSREVPTVISSKQIQSC